MHEFTATFDAHTKAAFRAMVADIEHQAAVTAEVVAWRGYRAALADGRAANDIYATAVKHSVAVGDLARLAMQEFAAADVEREQRVLYTKAQEAAVVHAKAEEESLRLCIEGSPHYWFGEYGRTCAQRATTREYTLLKEHDAAAAELEAAATAEREMIAAAKAQIRLEALLAAAARIIDATRDVSTAIFNASASNIVTVWAASTAKVKEENAAADARLAQMIAQIDVMAADAAHVRVKAKASARMGAEMRVAAMVRTAAEARVAAWPAAVAASTENRVFMRKFRLEQEVEFVELGEARKRPDVELFFPQSWFHDDEEAPATSHVHEVAVAVESDSESDESEDSESEDGESESEDGESVVEAKPVVDPAKRRAKWSDHQAAAFDLEPRPLRRRRDAECFSYECNRVHVVPYSPEERKAMGQARYRNKKHNDEIGYLRVAGGGDGLCWSYDSEHHGLCNYFWDSLEEEPSWPKTAWLGAYMSLTAMLSHCPELELVRDEAAVDALEEARANGWWTDFPEYEGVKKNDDGADDGSGRDEATREKDHAEQWKKYVFREETKRKNEEAARQFQEMEVNRRDQRMVRSAQLQARIRAQDNSKVAVDGW